MSLVGGAKGATRSSDALRRVAEEEGPAAMVRRLSRERDRDREAALAAATRMADVESSSKIAEDRRRMPPPKERKKKKSNLGLSESSSSSTDELMAIGGSSSTSTTSTSTKLMTLRQKIKSPSNDDLPAPSASSSSSSSSPSSSSSMPATVEKKKKTKAKKKEKERDENAEDERAAKLGEDRRRKPTKSSETQGKQREGSVRRERREKSEDGKNEKKEKKDKKKEKRRGSSTSGEFAVDSEPKKIGTLRKLVSHKPSVQFTKNEGACGVCGVRWCVCVCVCDFSILTVFWFRCYCSEHLVPPADQERRQGEGEHRQQAAQRAFPKLHQRTALFRFLERSGQVNQRNTLSGLCVNFFSVSKQCLKQTHRTHNTAHMTRAFCPSEKGRVRFFFVCFF
jgi:hypothetical protein